MSFTEITLFAILVSMNVWALYLGSYLKEIIKHLKGKTSLGG